MGPIERELRKAACWKTPFFAAQVLSPSSWKVCVGAATELGVSLLWTNWADIMSEAIEAAEALGL